MDHPSETSLCTVAPSPQTPLLPFFSREGAAVHRLYGTDNPDFQIKTYYLSDANHQTDNQSHTNNPSLV